jgi:hypothetical protein
MNAIQVSFLVVLAIEVLSVLELYFMQDKAVFNGVSIFSGWDISKEVPEVHELIRYLIHWVAGVKLIVIGLLLVLALTAPTQTLIYAGVMLILAISSFFWRMFPTIRKHDRAGLIEPRGRSQMVGMMVLGFEAALIASVMIEVVRF